MPCTQTYLFEDGAWSAYLCFLLSYGVPECFQNGWNFLTLSQHLELILSRALLYPFL